MLQHLQSCGSAACTAGEAAFDQLQSQQTNFQLTYADSLLAREKLDAALRYSLLHFAPCLASCVSN